MIVKKLTKKFIPNYSKLIQMVISNLNYYSDQAKKSEILKNSIKSLNKKIIDKTNLYLMAVDKGQIIGFCFGFFDSGVFWLDWIGVKREFRRRGIASRILDFLENYIKKRNTHKIWFDSRTNNKESIPLLKSRGYYKITTVKNHWYGLDFFLWGKSL